MSLKTGKGGAQTTRISKEGAASTFLAGGEQRRCSGASLVRVKGMEEKTKNGKKEQEGRKLVRQISRSESAFAILEYAFFTPAFSRNDIVTAISWKVESAVAGGLCKLLERGYLEIIDPKDAPHPERLFRLSDDGLKYLMRFDEYFKAHGKAYTPVTYKSAIKNKSKLKVTAFVHGAGLRVLPLMKPEFGLFIKILFPSLVVSPGYEASPLYAQADQNNINLFLSDGIFYSMREVREGFEKIGRGDDEFIASRCSGIIFNNNNIFVLYYSEVHTLVMVQYTEERLWERIQRIFIGKNYWQRPLICVCLAKSRLLAATLATGYKNGRMAYEKQHDLEIKNKLINMPENEKQEFLAAERARVRRAKEIAAKKRAHAAGNGKIKKIFFNAIDNKSFQEIYFVRVNKTETATLWELTRTDHTRTAEEGKAWFRNNNNFYYTGSNNLINGFCELSKTDAVYLPYINIKTLSALRDETRPVTVVCDPDNAEIISLCIGRIAADFYDIDTGTLITGVERFDEFGYPISGVYKYTEAAVRKRLENIQNRGPVPKRVRHTVSEWDTADPVYESLKQEFGLSREKLTEELAGYILTEETRLEAFRAYLRVRLEQFFDGKTIQNNPYLGG